jgi:type IV secretory pathway VirB10-like protein
MVRTAFRSHGAVDLSGRSSIDLDGMVSLDAQGKAGLRSKVDRHYRRMFGFAALSSLFTAPSK